MMKSQIVKQWLAYFRLAGFLLACSQLVTTAYAEDVPVALSATALTGNVTLVKVGDNNVVIANFDDELVIVDGGKPTNASALQNFIQHLFNNKSILALFNTHWHQEQVGLNYLLGKQGVRIIAHKNTQHWLSTSQYNVWKNIKLNPLSTSAQPTQTFYETTQVTINGKTIDAGYLPLAHTDSDIYIHFKDDNIIAVGGLISNDHWPEIDWWSAGWFGGMLDGLETILALSNDKTIIVPAHGMPMSKKELQQEYDMYVVLFERVLTQLKQSKSPAEAVAENPTKGFHPNWTNADAFVENAFRSLYGHLRGEKRMGLMP